MLTDPEGREVLRARPVINGATVDLAALAVSKPNMQHIIFNQGSSRVMTHPRPGYIFFRNLTGRVVSGWVGLGRVGSGRVGSGRVRRFSNTHGSVRSPLPDLTREMWPDP